MTDFLSTFQNTASALPQIVLAIVGGLLVWLGLFLWLGGLCWLKFFAGCAAAGIGYALAYFLTNREIYFLVGIPVLAALLAIFFEKTAVVLLTAVLIGVAVNLALVWPTLTDAKTWQNPPAVITSGQGDTMSQSLTVLENYVVWVGGNIYDSAKSLGTIAWAVYGVTILAVAGVGLLIPRGICALICSILGVVWISAGMFFLLLFKGSKPADIVLEKPSLFTMIAGGMVVLGVLINLAVAPAKARKKAVPPVTPEKV